MRQLLGTIATEGGLPLNQLLESGGWLARVLNPVIKKHLSKDLSVATLISNYQYSIPKSYRSAEMIEILADIVESVAYLRQEHQLEQKKNPIKWLDKNVSDWREKFPLPIDNNVAHSLLGELISTAAKEKNNQPQNIFELERYLIGAKSSPETVAQIDLPAFLPLENLSCSIDGNIPANFTVEVVANGITHPWCRGILTVIRKKKGFKFFGHNFKLSGENVTKELSLRFNAVGNVFFEIPLTNGFSLDEELPWLFQNIDDKWLLYGIASSSIKDTKARVYIPSCYSYELSNENSSIIELGKIYSGCFYELQGVINIYGEEEKYKISTGLADSFIQYKLSGQYYNNSSSPSEIYIGKPKLQEVNRLTGSITIPRNMQLQARLVGSRSAWQALRNIHQGYYEIRLLDNEGNIQLKKRVGILDEKFAYKIRPDSSDINKGSITLDGVSSCRLDVLGKNISHQIESTSISTKIHLQSDKNLTQYIDIALYPQQQSRELILSLPYPSRGALLFDSDKNNITFDTPLYLSNLRGYRIKVVDDKFITDKRISLNLSLVDNEIDYPSLKDIYIQIPIRLINQVTELVINDWVEPIETLLGVSSSPDSKVKISLALLGQEQFYLYIRQFENRLIPKHESGFVELSSAARQRVTSNDLDKMEVNALLLNQPEQADVILSAEKSESVVTGKWLFEPEKRCKGSWIIYPTSQSSITFRPILWSIGSTNRELVIANTLPKAIDIWDSKLRENAIRRILQKMTADIDHSGWNYLKNLWEKTLHLPAPTFDVWKIAISEPHFMAMLLLKNHDDIIEKLEKELPLLWELVSIQAWRDALVLWKEKLSNIFGEVEDADLATELLKKKIDKIESLSLSMEGIGKILKLEFLKENSLEIQAMKILFMQRLPLKHQKVKTSLEQQLPEKIQGLLRRKAEEEWPIFLSDNISNYYNQLDISFRTLLKAHHPFQQPIIFLPAILAWDMLLEKNFLGESHTAVEIFKIKQLKNFDEDWFNSVFQYLSVWLYQYFKEEELTHA